MKIIFLWPNRLLHCTFHRIDNKHTHLNVWEICVFFPLLFKSRRNRWRKCNLWMWTAARNGSNLSIIESYEALNFIVLDLFLAVNNFFVFASYLYRYTVYSVHGKSIHISRRLNTEFLSLPLVFVTKYASRLNITLICERRQVHTQTHWISICVHISSFVLYIFNGMWNVCPSSPALYCFPFTILCAKILLEEVYIKLKVNRLLSAAQCVGGCS